MQPMTCRLLSLLLHYPDGELLAHLGDIRTAAAALPEDPCAPAILQFVDHLEGRALLDLQLDYTALFDLCAATTLNLVNHLELAPEARAGLLSRLNSLYQAAGLDCRHGELPDYLPMLLEYLWLHPEAWEKAPLRQTLSAVPMLALRLPTAHAAFAALLKPMAAALQRRGIGPCQEVSHDPL